jgi:hypothetical protein
VNIASDRRLRAAVRRFTLGSGPLKRRSDRVQVLARFVVVLAFLAAPSLAVLAGTKTTTHLEELAATQAVDRNRTTATTLEEATTRSRVGDADSAVAVLVATPARWTTSSGADRTGSVLVPPGAPAGTTVEIWVDVNGERTHPPLDPRGIQGTATAMALLPLLGVPIAAWACYVILCAALDARRDRNWTEGWAAVEPHWKAQLP